MREVLQAAGYNTGAFGKLAPLESPSRQALSLSLSLSLSL